MNVFPIYNILVVPDANIYIKTDTYEKVTGRSAVAEDKLVIVVAKEDLKREEFTSDSFYPIGLRATIAEVNPNGFIMLRTANRVNIDDVAVYRDHTIDLTISRRNDINDLDPEEARRKLHSVKTAMMKFSESFQWGQAARGFIA
ncbi:MAG: endopeptidase La, partial [Oscillospiraceae bacterium]|nr:endopeptidase La [Oscillospiraceae bacterium]